MGSLQENQTANLDKLTFCTIWLDAKRALSSLHPAERFAVFFWLCGPLILLIERTPADLWLSVLALAFIVRAFFVSDFLWLSFLWVKLCFSFLAICVLSSFFSVMPLHAVSEALIWFRFPLFAMATVFWLGKDRRLLRAMFISTALGMLIMTCILTLELTVSGHTGDARLTWPYGDATSGNYLAKVSLPAFTALAALTIGSRPRVAFFAGFLTCFTLAVSLLTGERVNFLIRVCAAALALISWRVNLKRVFWFTLLAITTLLLMLGSFHDLKQRVVDGLLNAVSDGFDSPYFLIFFVAIEAAKESLILGLGPATYRELCPNLVLGANIQHCYNHPHNFYVQLWVETGIVGLFFGLAMITSIFLEALKGWWNQKNDVLAATAFITPLAFFFPIATSSDFFGQWNNVFMWSAIGLALAAASKTNSSS
jgi:O-antigen ligase